MDQHDDYMQGSRFLERSRTETHQRPGSLLYNADFNDRDEASDEQPWEVRKAKFLKELGGTINESAAQRKADDGPKAARHVETCVDERGQLTEDFKEEL